MIQRILPGLVGLLFLAAALVFTSLLVAAVLTAGLLARAWLWWRGRRRGGRVIEGEYRIIESR